MKEKTIIKINICPECNEVGLETEIIIDDKENSFETGKQKCKYCNYSIN